MLERDMMALDDAMDPTSEEEADFLRASLDDIWMYLSKAERQWLNSRGVLS